MTMTAAAVESARRAVVTANRAAFAAQEAAAKARIEYDQRLLQLAEETLPDGLGVRRQVSKFTGTDPAGQDKEFFVGVPVKAPWIYMQHNEYSRNWEEVLPEGALVFHQYEWSDFHLIHPKL